MRILIVKTSSLGDIIHAFPVISFICKYFPGSQIDWVVEKPFADLVDSHPDIHRVIEVDTRQWRRSLFCRETWAEIARARKSLKQCNYDIAFDLQGNTKSGIILSCVKADRKIGFGKKTVPEWPNTLFTNEEIDPPPGNNIREDYLAVVKEGVQVDESYLKRSVDLEISQENKNQIDLFLKLSTQNILICPGAHWENKRLSLDTLKEIIQLIHKNHPAARCLYAWGTEGEKRICQVLHDQEPEKSSVLPKLELSTLQQLMSQVSLVFAMDSLPLHLAGTTETPTFGVFGPSQSKKYAPIGPQSQSIQGACPYKKTFEKRCPILRTCSTGACVKNLKAQEIYNSLLLGTVNK
jgi:lipopolysaccharide heptosyltransferase I